MIAHSDNSGFGHITAAADLVPGCHTTYISVLELQVVISSEAHKWSKLEVTCAHLHRGEHMFTARLMSLLTNLTNQDGTTASSALCRKGYSHSN
eukprot:5431421-Amphidinium_carterae.2